MAFSSSSTHLDHMTVCQGVGTFVPISVRWSVRTHILGVLRGLNKSNCMKCLPYIIRSGGIPFLSGRSRAVGDGAWLPSLALGYNRLASSKFMHGNFAQGVRDALTTCLTDRPTLLSPCWCTCCPKGHVEMFVFKDRSFRWA